MLPRLSVTSNQQCGSNDSSKNANATINTGGPALTVDELVEQLQVMCRLEGTTYQAWDYQAQQKVNKHTLLQQRRSRMLEYLYVIVDYAGFHRDTVVYAMTHLMDRYLATTAANGTTTKMHNKEYQLIALTCLYMAIKLLEPHNIGVDAMPALAQNLYGVEDFLAMEGRILETLEWKVGHGPTPLAFVQLVLSTVLTSLQPQAPTLLPSFDNIIHTMYHHAQYQLELAASNYKLTCCDATPSQLAVAAMWNALEGLDNLDGFSLEQQAFFQHRVLQVFQRSLSTSTLSAKEIYGRLSLYQKERIGQLQSRLTQLTVDVLDFQQQQQQQTKKEAASQEEPVTPTAAAPQPPTTKQPSIRSPVSVVRKETTESSAVDDSDHGKDRDTKAPDVTTDATDKDNDSNNNCGRHHKSIAPTRDANLKHHHHHNKTEKHPQETKNQKHHHHHHRNKQHHPNHEDHQRYHAHDLQQKEQQQQQAEQQQKAPQKKTQLQKLLSQRTRSRATRESCNKSIGSGSGEIDIDMARMVEWLARS